MFTEMVLTCVPPNDVHAPRVRALFPMGLLAHALTFRGSVAKLMVTFCYLQLMVFLMSLHFNM
jgi:hypothetical protein